MTNTPSSYSWNFHTLESRTWILFVDLKIVLVKQCFKTDYRWELNIDHDSNFKHRSFICKVTLSVLKQSRINYTTANITKNSWYEKIGRTWWLTLKHERGRWFWHGHSWFLHEKVENYSNEWNKIKKMKF